MKATGTRASAFRAWRAGVERILARGLDALRPLAAPGARALSLLCLVTFTLAAMLAVALVAAAARSAARASGVPAEIPVPPARVGFPEVVFKRPGESPAADASAEEEAPRANDGPVVHWREEQKLRRAAGLLLLAGDHEAAMELLLGVSADESRAFALDRAAHGRILLALPAALADERAELGRFLGGLPEEARTLVVSAAARGELDGFLGLPRRELFLRECARRLPERLLFTFVGNVHVRLAGATGADGSLLSLLLETGFPQGSLAGRAYRELLPDRRAEYDGLVPETGALPKGSR